MLGEVLPNWVCRVASCPFRVYTLREHVNLVRGILDKQESHS